MGREGAFKDRPLWRRLQAIHHEIKEGRLPNASSLATSLAVSSKTIQRDLDYLRDELAAPIEFDRQRNGYVYSRPDYVLPFLPVDGKDLFAIGVAAQVLELFGGTPLARDLKACYGRLAELMPPAVRLGPDSVMGRLALRASSRQVREETWQAVSDAMQKGLALSIRYRHLGEEPGPARVVHPYAFVLSARDWMMLAHDRDAGQVKNFYLARIASARLTTERYAIPKDFDADTFFRHTFGLFVGGAKPFRLRVAFSRRAAKEVSEITWHPRQKLEPTPDGGVILELPAQSPEEARRFVLPWGAAARVLSPPELVEDMRRESASLARVYGRAASEKKTKSPRHKERS
jgi:proteasome accessory factor B